MGQACSSCCGVCLKKSRRRHARHKRYDFAPKRSWKYKDATLLNEFHEMEMTHDMDSHHDNEQLISDNGAAAASSGGVRNHIHLPEDSISSDGDEEIDTANYRQGGRLVFTEGDSDDDMTATPTTKGGYTHLEDEEDEDDCRGRSQSTGSEQIGRFEVWDVDERENDSSLPDGSQGDTPLSKHEAETSQFMPLPQM